MLRLLPVFVLILYSNVLPAQEKTFRINTLPDTAQASHLMLQARDIRDISLDSAIVLAKKALIISKKANEPLYIIRATLDLGAYQYEQKAYGQCKSLYTYLLQNYSRELTKSKSLLALVYNNMANVHLKQEQLDSAIYYYYQSLEAIKKKGIENKPMQSLVYSNLGAALAISAQQKQALYYLGEALNLTRQLKDTNLMAQNILNIGITHEDTRNYETALTFYKDALKLFAVKKNIRNIQSTYRTIGEAYDKIGKYQTALAYYDSATNTDKEKAARNAGLQIRYGDIYKQTGDYSKAIGYYESALKLMPLEGSFLGKPVALYALAECYHAINDNARAYTYQKAYSDLRDSILNEEKIKTMNQLEVKYRTTEQKKKLVNQDFLITRQEKALLQKNAWLGGISLGSLLLLSLLFSLYRNHRHKHMLQKAEMASMQQQQEIVQLRALMQGEENERARIAQELHDGIGSLIAAARMHLDIFKGNKELPGYASSYKSGLNLLDEAYQDLRNTAHNLIPEQLLVNGFSEGIKEYCKKISKHDTFSVQCQTIGSPPALDAEKSLSLYRIVQELIHNALKHGEANEVVVEIAGDGQHTRINVEDNGKGWESAQDSSSCGIGFRNLRQRIKALGGTMEVDSRKDVGTTVYLTFEKKDAYS